MAASQAAKPDAKQLGNLLRTLDQGDIVSVGAVSIVGTGDSEVAQAARGHSAGATDTPEAEQPWAVTVNSTVGWYTIVSGTCEIRRDPSIEPCVVLAPISEVTAQRYDQLRSGEYSPREFPLPANEVASAAGRSQDDFWPVVDMRMVTSVDKNALVHNNVDWRRPLTGPQRRRFGEWVANRFGRPTHSDELETHVLGPLGREIGRYAASFADADKPAGAANHLRMVGAARAWLIGGNDHLIHLYPVVDAESCKRAGLWQTKAKDFDQNQVNACGAALRKKLIALIKSGAVVKVEPITLDALSAAEYLALREWRWADISDPLDE